MEEDILCRVLPKHVLEQMILPKLGLKYFVRFSAVCRLWRSIAVQNRVNLYPQRPWLMISCDKDTQIATFFSPCESKTYHLKLTKLQSESSCIGSSQDLLIMANKNSIFFFNPFSKIQLSLPGNYVKIDTNPDKRHLFKKAILLSPPGTSNSRYIVGAMRYEFPTIDMCKPNIPEWSSEVNAIRHDKFLDILFYKGKLYGLTRKNRLVKFELRDTKLLEYEVLNVLPTNELKAKNGYLVESCGELLMVHRYCKPVRGETNAYLTFKFLVYKLDQSTELLQWVPVRSLDDQVLFLGKNASKSVSAKNISVPTGNCIYFADDHWPNYCIADPDSRFTCSDNGVFYLDNECLELFFKPGDSYSFKSQPIWVTPNIELGEIPEVKNFA